MKKIFLLSSAILLLMSYQSSRSVDTLSDYEKWQIQHSKQYFGAEKLYREQVFLDNQRKIQMHNSDPTQTYSMGENQFMTLTSEEFAAIYSSSILPPKQTQNDIPLSDKKFGPVDYRNQLSVSNRGNCEAGWAFSVSGMIDAFYMIQKKQNINSSPQELIDCDYQSMGCDWGHNEYALQRVKSHGGIASNQTYPYVGYQQSCRYSARQFYISGYNYVQQSSENLQESLQFNAISVGADTRNWQFYKDGVFSFCGQDITSYALLVGYDEFGNWIVQNSLGYNWGNNGSIILAPGNTCGILNYAFEIY